MSFWSHKKVMVTGGAGFLGSFVVEKLTERGCGTIIVPRSKEFDLRDRDMIVRLYSESRPDIVIHLAAVVGGIGANRANPGRFFYDNAIYLLPVNLYGPRDNFDLDSSHVIPAMIRKCVEAKQAGRREIVLWGDGSPTREFLFAEDAAEGIVLAAERYNGEQPVNLGSGHEISIRDLAQLIAGQVGFSGKIVWDTSKPNGQPRRCLDVSRAEKLFGFRAACSFAEGIRRTVAWYLSQAAVSNDQDKAKAEVSA